MQHIGEGYLTVPSDWHNSSVNIYTAQPPGMKGLSITVNRDRIAFGTTLKDYIEAQTKKLQDQLKDYRLIHDEPATVDGKEGHIFEFSWNSADSGEIHQVLLALLDGQVVLNFAGTSIGKMNNTQRNELAQMLLSFKFDSSHDKK